ncbi:MAG: hypothetical protein ACRD1Y_00550 [Terriglobales bacterium]
MLSGRFIHATRSNIVYNPSHVSFYQLEDNGNKVKLHFMSGESKDLEGEDARLFLTEVEHVPITPSQAA